MKAARRPITHLLLAAFFAAFIAAVLCSHAEAQTAADLQQRADNSHGADCAHLSMQAARQLLEDADKQFEAGNLKAAHEGVDAAVRYAHRATDCSLEARKVQKNTEIELRKLIRRTKDVMQTLDSEDRPHLSQAILELEKQRNRVLHGMFGAAAPGDTTEKKP